jgi:hypothetical protein
MVLLDDIGSERDTAANALPDVIFERPEPRVVVPEHLRPISI